MNHADPHEDELRPHTYDGIQEYDKRLPNWWLWTLYLAILFSIAYWAYYHLWRIGDAPHVALEKRMAENQLAVAKAAGTLDDDILWSMSQDPKVVGAGKGHFESNCVSCHMADLSGGIGPNLKDDVWIHGGKPMEIMHTLENGVLDKGMPSWAAQLGRTRMAEVAAYILSFHKKTEAQ